MTTALTVERLIEVFRSGSSTPALALGSDGRRWVVKFQGAAAGVEVLLTELIVNALCRASGLPVPETKPIRLASDFPWQVGTDEFDDVVRRSGGWNLAVALVEGAEDVKRDGLDALPTSFLSVVATIDRCFRNVDRTTAHPNLLRDPSGHLWAIDHGSCLFLRSRGDFSLPRNHFLAASPPLLRLDVSNDTLAELCAGLPADWLESARLEARDLPALLRTHLDAFSAFTAAQGAL